ncbi:MAG TPA: SIMPL domain-containing protein [Vicinamibacterales bacterium]|nr:SIMPL domain-containing protein [Vicinamibacterales bacterium]
MHRFRLGLLFVLLAAATANAQMPPPQQEPPVIVAQGEAIVRQAPDVAWVQIAVEARGAKPEDARQKAAEAMTAVLAALKPVVPAPNLRTSGLAVTPEIDYTTGGSRLKGYLARNQVEARVDNLELLSKVMDASIASGATTISGLRFDVKARAQHEREALRNAVQDATERAQAIAAGAGRTLGPIVRIQEQRMSTTPYRVTMGGAGGGRGGQLGEATPITPGEIEIRAIVVLTAAIK